MVISTDLPASQPISQTRMWAARAQELERQYDDLLAENGPALRRVASTYEADRAIQEDLFQEICLAIWKALPRFRGDASLRTFVFRIAHNRGLSHGWKASRLPVELEEPELVVDTAPSPEDKLDRRRRQESLRTAIRQLPLSSRQVLTMRLEGLSYREISEVLGGTENNAMVRASRARGRLAEILAGPEESKR